MKALILVDIQKDFLPGGALPVPRGDEVVEVANRLIGRFDADLVLATQDWHPPGHGSFASSHPGKTRFEVIELHGLEQILWPDHCLQKSNGADLATGLQTSRIDKVFTKGEDPTVDSYSGFFDNGHRKDTGLAGWLKERGVTDVYVAGLALDVCVKYTALDARRLGFNTFLVVDGCRGVDVRPGDSERAIDEMKRAGVQVVTSTELERESTTGVDGGESMTERGHELMDHTGDMALRFWAPTEEELLIEGAQALIRVLTEGKAPKSASTWQLRIDAIDAEDRLVQWLNEVLILATLKGFLFADAELSLQGTALEATLQGQADSWQDLRTELKSVTYHDIELGQTNGGWRAQVVVDV
jgi:nicotinamidase/pyrazinamidase